MLGTTASLGGIGMERIGHYIGGKHVSGESGRTGPVYDPSTGQQTHEVDFADVVEIDRAIEAAREAFPAWRATSLSKRAEIMFRFRELLDVHKAEVAAVLTAQHGKVLSDAMGEVQRGLENVEFATAASAVCSMSASGRTTIMFLALVKAPTRLPRLVPSS